MLRTQTEINILPAYNGDSILIKTFDENKEQLVIIIDGGTSSTFNYSLKKNLQDIKRINLIVLTHIDSDHIGGLISFFNNSLIDKIEIDEIWINEPDLEKTETNKKIGLISVPQAENYKELIKEKKPYTKLREITTKDNIIPMKGLEFTILSPTIEIKSKLYEIWENEKNKLTSKRTNLEVDISSSYTDFSKSLEELNKINYKSDSTINGDIYNSSSIAFLLRCPDLSILLLADSRAEVIVKRLRELEYDEVSPLDVNFVKISHHGSLNNTSQELLSLLKSNNYIISTNGGTAKHKHPSRETLARIVYKVNRDTKKLNIFTNYNIEDIKTKRGAFVSEEDLEEGNWNIEHKNIFTTNDILQ